MQTRIYVVMAHNKPNRLVEAASAAQAIRHCAAKEYSAKIPSTKEVANHMALGIVVEQACSVHIESASISINETTKTLS